MAAAGRLSILDRFLTLWTIYCWTRITYEAATDERKRQIFMLGVDPDYRTFAMTQWTTRACSQLKVEDTLIL